MRLPRLQRGHGRGNQRDGCYGFADGISRQKGGENEVFGSKQGFVADGEYCIDANLVAKILNASRRAKIE